MRPTRILILQRALDPSAYPEDAVMAVVHYVNELRMQLWRDDEILESAWQLVYANTYEAEVQNGGHSQFFFNASPRARVIRLAREGLRMVGAIEQLAILDRAIALVTGELQRIDDLDDESFSGAVDEVAPKLHELDDALYAIPDERGLATLARDWLRASPEVELVDDAEYLDRLGALRDAVPDRAAREAEADAAREAAMLPFEHAIRAACRERGLEYKGLTSGTPQRDGSMAWSFFASGQRRVACVRGEREIDEIRWEMPAQPPA